MASAVNIFTVWDPSRSPEYRGNDIDDQFPSLRKKKDLSEEPGKNRFYIVSKRQGRIHYCLDGEFQCERNSRKID